MINLCKPWFLYVESTSYEPSQKKKKKKKSEPACEREIERKKRTKEKENLRRHSYLASRGFLHAFFISTNRIRSYTIRYSTRFVINIRYT